MRSTWTSPVFHPPAGDNRQRDVLPLPLLADSMVDNLSVCRAVQRRVLRKGHVAGMVNKAIMALNSLFNGGALNHEGARVDEVASLPLGQQLAIKDIIASVKKLGAPPIACGPGALQTLRAASSSYCEAESGVGDVVPLAFSDLSLPSKGVVGVDLLDAVESPLKEVVADFEATMLQDADIWTSLSRNPGGLKFI